MKLVSFISLLALLSGFCQRATAQENLSEQQRIESWLAIQGEYTRTDANDSIGNVGIQVIATGDDGYQLVAFSGGLPGAGWNGSDPIRFESTSGDGKMVFDEDSQALVIEKGAGQGQFEGGLDRVERASKTIDKQAPSNAMVLFDGSSGEQFKAQDGGNPVMDGLLRPGIVSNHNVGDFQLHVEFKLPFEPTKTGQARGNSGIYLQGRYEVQMLDSFGLSGEDNECGGIYGIKKPDVNMCYPPESWQTYDIDFTAARWNEAGEKTANARMTVRHNGVLIHDDVEVPKTTTAAPLKENSEPGYIYLQDHGSPVRYRNIWVVEK